MRNFTISLALVLMPPTVLAQATPPLDSGDFVVARLRQGLDSGSVRASFGAPDSIYITRDGQADPRWNYGPITVQFGWEGKIVSLALTRRGLSTARGLQVGDSSARVVRLYGEPYHRLAPHWDYSDPKDENRVMRVTVRNGLVERIWFGWLHP